MENGRWKGEQGQCFGEWAISGFGGMSFNRKKVEIYLDAAHFDLVVGRWLLEQEVPALAAAIGLDPGEEVEWELLSRSELHRVRKAMPRTRATQRVQSEPTDCSLSRNIETGEKHPVFRGSR